ncbi:MAG TPA: hypothetical protein DCM87_02060 [Planctomycetes bacterium]|nr:hypothetical protein [Planctomycetota bacterium]
MLSDAGARAARAGGCAVNTFPGRVVAARDANLRGADGAVRPPRLGELLAKALRRLGDAGDARAFWSRLLKPGEKIGLKVNCLAGARLSTTPELVRAVVASLGEAGIPSGDIVVWERTARELKAAGLTARTAGARCAGTDEAGGYETAIATSGEVGSCLSRILTRDIAVLINIGVLKDHDLAGVSIGMKNLYGVLHNPNKYHDNTCDPYVADAANLPVVRAKLRLTIADGTLAQCHGGPAFSPAHAWEYNGILAGTDPVAVDRVGCEIIERRRKARGLPSLAEAARWPKWLATAAAYGLGEADLARVKVLEEGDGM